MSRSIILRTLLFALLPMILLVSWVGQSSAAVTRIEITGRESYAEGKEFGSRGAYEKLTGRVYFAVDPLGAANRAVIDVQLAPRNELGLVEFAADLEILAPVDPAKASGTLLYDVNNRGNRVCLGQYNAGGNDFLMRQGYIVVWSGWIAELLPSNTKLKLDAPVATEHGRPITGLVRAEMTPNEPAERMDLAQWGGNGSYEPTERGLRTATLTWRLCESDPRVVIPRAQWQLDVKPRGEDWRRTTLPTIELTISGGFRPGYIYELVYEAQGPQVQGLGLAGIRDLISCLKYDNSRRNPLLLSRGKPAVTHTIGFGVSQSGRCLRTFLYDGFNADEQGRQVFDGLIPHVAGGGLGFFNHRFASPTRHNAQHDNHLYPADVFPFAYGPESDPFSVRREGLLDRARASGTVPKVMHTQTSSEYWSRSGSLVHTDPLGQVDAKIPPEVRIYTFGGCQHGAGSGRPQAGGNGQLPRNPSDYRPFNRALLIAMDNWIRTGAEPPPSVFPKIADGTLVGWQQAASGWQPLPGIRYPEVIQQPEYQDRGPEYLEHRRTAIEPPVTRGKYVVKVPRYDAANNEQGTLALPSVAVPVATLGSWNLRRPEIGAPTELLSLNGSYIPFARTRQQREQAGDPRPALLERYQDFDDYRKAYTEATRRLVSERYLLAEEFDALVQQADRNRPLFESGE